MPEKQKYSSWRRPFRLQVSPPAASGFQQEEASLGQCQIEGCQWFEWRTGARYCRPHWLEVYQKNCLPEQGV